MCISVLFISGEITWWLGIVLLGKQVYEKYKKYFNPKTWFESKKGVIEPVEKESIKSEKVE